MNEGIRSDFDEGWGLEESDIRDSAERAKLASNADIVRIYLTQIGRTPLLTAEEEVDLSKRIEAGLYAGKLLTAIDDPEEVPQIDKETVASWGQKIDADPQVQVRKDLQAIALDGANAKDHLLRANLRLVVSVAKRYPTKHMPFLDLVQEGNAGLVRAVEKFDYAKGFKFSTYATWWIRQAITRSLHDSGRTIRLPVHLAEQVHKVDRTRHRMHQDLERDPTPEEIGLELDMPEERIVELLEYNKDIASLDGFVSDTEEARLGDFIEDTDAGDIGDAYEVEERSAALYSILESLEDRERDIISMRFGLNGSRPQTLEVIGKRFGLSRERVRQIERESMQKLRDPERMRKIEDFSGI